MSTKWIEGMNKMNMNIVPSTFVKEIMSSSVTFDNTEMITKQKKGDFKK